MTVTDTLEPGLTLNGAVTGAGWACTTAGSTITCTRSDPLAAGSDYPPISIPVLVSPAAQPGQLSNTASLAARERRQPRQQLLHRRRRRQRAGDRPARREGRHQHAGHHAGRLRHRRDGHLPHRGHQQRHRRRGQRAARRDVRRAPHPSQSITPSQGSCSGTVCNLGTITPGQAPVTIDVQVVLPPDLDGLSVRHAAEQHGDGVGPGRHRDQP